MKQIIIALLLVTFSVYSFAGKDRGGGNPKEQGFMKNFSDGMDKLRQIAYAEDDLESTLGNFFAYHWVFVDEQVNNIKVEFTSKSLNLDGVSKTAINYPSKWLIQVNELEWDKLSTQEKEALAVHEVLGVIEGNESEKFAFVFDDSSYAISGRLRTDLSQNKIFYAIAGYYVPTTRKIIEENGHQVCRLAGYQNAQDKATKLCKTAGYTLCELKDWGLKDFSLDYSKSKVNCKVWAEVEGKRTGDGFTPVSQEIGNYSDILRRLSTRDIQIQFQKVMVPGGPYSFQNEYLIKVKKHSDGYVKTPSKRFCMERFDCKKAIKNLDGQSVQSLLIHAQCVKPKRNDNCEGVGTHRKAQVLEVYAEGLN